MADNVDLGRPLRADAARNAAEAGRPLRADAARNAAEAGRPLRADAARNAAEAGRPLRADAARNAAEAGRPLRADAARNREKVLRAARDAFAESGYGVPLDEIAARAGVGPGTVYRHFPTKEALFEAVVTARVQDLVADARARAYASDAGGAFFGFLARIAAESAAKRDLPDAISIAGSLREDLNAALDVLLRHAQQAGAVRADVREPDLIVLFKGLFASLADISDPARRDLVFAVLADGLRPSR